MKTLLLLRHSIPERTGSDPCLSADGIQLAEQVFQTELFRHVSVVWSSPAQRAAQTAARKLRRITFQGTVLLDGKLPPACCFVVCKSPTSVESCSFFRDFYKNVLTTF